MVRWLIVVNSCVLLLSGCGAAANWESSAASATPIPAASRDIGRQPSTSGTAKTTAQKPRAVSANSGSHLVVDGDTLYSIAWRYQLDYRDLSRWNGRENSSLIYSGERLRLTPPAQVSKSVRSKKSPRSTGVVGGASRRAKNPDEVAGGASATREVPVDYPGKSAAEIVWQWPTKGAVSSVSYGPQSKLKGLLISGEIGQPINAAAAGTVVYIGSGLSRYGQLVIVKHSDNIFSAYAHLQTIGVKQGQWVTAGKQLATMGSVDGSDQTALRFDIRDGAESLSPLPLLPEKPSSALVR